MKKGAIIKFASIDKNGEIIDSPLRSDLWSAQTPQGFPVDKLKHAHGEAIAKEWSAITK